MNRCGSHKVLQDTQIHATLRHLSTQRHTRKECTWQEHREPAPNEHCCTSLSGKDTDLTHKQAEEKQKPAQAGQAQRQDRPARLQGHEGASRAATDSSTTITTAVRASSSLRMRAKQPSVLHGICDMR